MSEGGAGHSSRQSRSMGKQGGSGHLRLGDHWPRNKPKGSERLGPFDEERAEDPLAFNVVTEVRAGSTPTSMALEDQSACKNIVVTNGITTRFEDREGDDNVRSRQLSRDENNIGVGI